MTIRVLILDDEPLFGQSLVQSLALCDEPPIAARAVTTAAEALAEAELAAAQELPFDAFLIDQRLGPGPDGIDVLHELLARSPHSDAIVFTVAGDRQAGMRAYQAGAYRYLHKPFHADELVLVLQTLQRMRETRLERDWLRVIAEIAAAAQRLLSLAEVQREIVASGARLGFDRTRLWLYVAERGEMVGAAQVGSDGAEELIGLRFPAGESPYMALLTDREGPLVFRDQERGASYIYQLFGAAGYSAPVGDWVGLPLRTAERLIGVLMLDNYQQPRLVRPDQLHALAVFGRQVAVALERAQLHEREQRRGREIAVLAEIGRLVSGSAAILPLEELLAQIREQVGRLMAVDNFFIGLRDELSGQLDLRLEVELGRPRPPKSLRPRSGLVSWVVRERQPLLLATQEEIDRFARSQRLRRKGARARCWLGVPLTLEARTIGAMVVQSYSAEHAYSDEDRRLLAAVAAQVAGAVHTARLSEEAALDSRRMRTLVEAGRDLISLAATNSYRFWHLALTMATAGYAIGFNRALLLLLGPDGSALHGELGIGHLKGQTTRAAWRRDEARGLDLAAYRRLMEAGAIEPTDIDRPVRSLVLPLAGPGALFAEALGERRRVLVERHAIGRLPADFTAAFGQHPYAILPIYAGEKRFGVLVVDNCVTGMQLLPSRLDQLETWLAQVALAYENRRQQAASERLVSHAPDLLARAADHPLRETLDAICQMALALTAADNAMIYPLDREGMHYDLLRVGQAGGLLQPFDSQEPPDLPPPALRAMAPDELRVLESIDPAALAPEQTFVRRERIRASIAAPLHKPISGELMGLLYLNYRHPQRFSAHEQGLARNLARLSAATIGTARTIGSVRDQVSLGEHELSLLSRVLRQSLEREADQRTIVHALLDAARDLLVVPDWQVGLVLREWRPPDAPEGKARELRLKISYPPGSTTRVEVVDEHLYTGITGYAMQTESDQRVGDVTAPPWNLLYRPRFPESPTSEAARTRSELDVLIRLDGQILGLFNVESPQINAFTEEHHERLRRLADVSALALDNQRRREHQRAVLNAASEVVAASDVDQTLHAVLAATRRAAPDVSAVAIWRVDQERKRIVEGPSFGIRRPPALRAERLDDDKVLNRVLAAAGPIWAEDAAADPQVRGRFVKREGIASVAAFPLIADGEPVGVLFFNYHTPHRFSRYEQILFKTFAAIVAGALRDALHLDMTRRQSQRLVATIRVAEAVGTTLDLEGSLRKILATLREIFRERADSLQLAVLLFDEPRTLAFHAVSREFYNLQFVTRLPVLDIYDEQNPSIACRVARTAIAQGQPIWEHIADVEQDPDYMRANTSTRCELCLALMSTERDRFDRPRLLGTLVLESDQINAFDEHDVALVSGIGTTISLAIERARTAGKLSLQSAVAAATVWIHESAHEINHQIGVIRRDVYALMADPGVSPRQVPALRRIDRSAALLGAAAIDPRSLAAEPLAIRQWLHSQLPGLVPPEVTLTIEADEELRVLAVGVLLERAVTHLVRNALEAMERSGWISVQVRADISTASLSFANSGPTIPPEIRGRLLSEGVTTKDKRKSGEGGLGLLFVRWAVEQMGGSVALSSAEAPVTFEIRLPLAARAPQAEPQLSEVHP